MPPARLVAAYAGKGVAEVGAGPRFEDALAFARAGCRVVVADLHPRVLEAPPPLHALVDDVTRPAVDRYQNPALVYGVRLPEELHAAAARLAVRLGADLALALVGDEAPHARLPGAPIRVPEGGRAWWWWRG